MPRVVHFEIEVDNAQCAIHFYTSVFGWKIDKWGGPMDYWLVVTGQAPEPGIDGALKLRGASPAPAVNSISVPSVDDFAVKIRAAGGQTIQPKMPIPGVGYYALCKDSEGNAFGIMQADPEAK